MLLNALLQRVERIAGVIRSRAHNARDRVQILNALDRVGTEHDEVRVFADVDRAHGRLATEKLRAVERRHLQHFERREPGRPEQVELLVQSKARDHPLAAEIGAGEHHNAGRLERPHQMRLQPEELLQRGLRRG